MTREDHWLARILSSDAGYEFHIRPLCNSVLSQIGFCECCATHLLLFVARGSHTRRSSEQFVHGVPVCERLHLTLRAWQEWQARAARFLGPGAA